MTELTDRDPSDLSADELRAEWREACERLQSHTVAEADKDDVHDRRRELWTEMQARVDAEPPECPECGGTSWSQTMGDPKECSECGFAPWERHQDLIDEINAYWRAVRSGGEATA